MVKFGVLEDIKGGKKVEMLFLTDIKQSKNIPKDKFTFKNLLKKPFLPKIKQEIEFTLL